MLIASITLHNNYIQIEVVISNPEDHFIKVEIHSIDQASSINSTGVFRVGCFLDSKDQNFKV